MTAADITAFLNANADDDATAASAAPTLAAAPPPTITGYAAVFYDLADRSTVGIADDGAELRLMPTAFRHGFDPARVVALLDHRPDRVLGDGEAGSLRLAVDRRGLRYWLQPADTRAGWALARAVREGGLSGSSCTYRVESTTELRDGGRVVRQLWDVSLMECGPSRRPRFPGACCWVEQPNPDLDEFARFAAVMRNLELAGG